ncbi:MAG: GNAT family N-acetyltransferase, partial [Bacteroidota bacterium]
GKGYATEGAKRCLEYAFNDLNIDKIVAICTKDNLKSEHIMKKIGMRKRGEFHHPHLKEYPEYEKCIWYEITKTHNDMQGIHVYP